MKSDSRRGRHLVRGSGNSSALILGKALWAQFHTRQLPSLYSIHGPSGTAHRACFSTPAKWCGPSLFACLRWCLALSTHVPAFAGPGRGYWAAADAIHGRAMPEPHHCGVPEGGSRGFVGIECDACRRYYCQNVRFRTVLARAAVPVSGLHKQR